MSFFKISNDTDAVEQALQSFEDINYKALLKGEEAGVSFASETPSFLHVDYIDRSWTYSTTHSCCGFLRLALQVTVIFPVLPGHPW